MPEQKAHSHVSLDVGDVVKAEGRVIAVDPDGTVRVEMPSERTWFKVDSLTLVEKCTPTW